MENKKELRSWLDNMNLSHPLVIAGPCSAETEEQVLETARGIAKEGYAHVLRAGVWKPRTRPGSFEGKGEEALPWLQQAKKETGLPIAIEVATPQHVELAMKYDVDILWIGARTTVNPFNVQDLADAMKGLDVPVLIKNPVNPMPMPLRIWPFRISLKCAIWLEAMLSCTRKRWNTCCLKNTPICSFLNMSV